MSEAEHTDISPAQVITATGEASCFKRTALEQACEFGSESECGEPSEQKHQPGSQILQNEPREKCMAGSSLVGYDQLCLSSEDVKKDSLAENLGVPFENASTSNEAGDTACREKIMLEQMHQHDSGIICSESSGHKHQIGSEIVQNEPEESHTGAFSCLSNVQLLPLSENMTNNSLAENLGIPAVDVSKSSQAGEVACPEQTIEPGLETGCGEPSDREDQLDAELVHIEPLDITTTISSCNVIEHGMSPEVGAKSSLVEHLGLPPKDATRNLGTEQLGPASEDAAKDSLEQLETPPENATTNSSLLGRRDKRTSKSSKKKSMSRSLVSSDRVLRLRSQEKPEAPEPNNNLANVDSGRAEKRKKKKRGEKIIADEYSKISKHLRYLLNRMGYERSLIDAYSSEGWKGLSLEKLKPEKELQRATSEILRCKLKIRDLFQRLDSLCAEGRLPEVLFDSEGEIDSEDIFCSKCGSKDLLANNDIILCDGACDRGFHQLCLEPPLSNEDIPPGDEGWLCPGCDCKFDCIDLLNDYQGTSLSISDNWEKVYPEAAAAAAGHNQDHNFGLPSDDSEDDDYDPEGLEVDEKVQGDKSSSDESEYISASEELEAPQNDKQYLGLPSDDSEDDDYNPDAPALDEEDKQESSSSDFTSDSEDLGAFDEERFSRKDEVPMSSPMVDIRLVRGSDLQQSKHSGKKQSLKDELLSLLKSDPDLDASTSGSGKRHIDRLDYKMLHDEAYGNGSSDSSDDEDWTDSVAPKKRKRSTGKVARLSPNGNSPTIKNGMKTEDIKHNAKETKHTPETRTRQKLKFETANNSRERSDNGSSNGYSGKRAGSSAHRRLGEAVTQKLYNALKENEYPDRSTKESLGKELGITFQQVSKWFENARWSLRNSPSMEANMAKTASRKGNPLPQASKPESGPETVARDATRNGAKRAKHKESPKTCANVPDRISGDAKESESASRESSRQKSTPPQSRKRKGKLDNLASSRDSKRPANLPKTPEVQTGSRIQTKRRKSAT